jgi:protoporphyrinogen oxidase
MKIGILGGGIMGLSLGYFLVRSGAEVEIFEASPTLGGLAGTTDLPDGTPVDRFYHTILPSDGYLHDLCTELGIADQLRFRPTRTAFFYRGRLHSMNNIIEFLRFPPLGWIDRFRLGLTVLAAQQVRDWRKLERVSVERWLVHFGGRNAFENIWRPLLRSKFDGTLFDDVPATWIWSRLVRMKSARSGAAQQEGAGHLVGGYATLVSALANNIRQAGGLIHTRCPVQEIAVENGAAAGLRMGPDVRRFDAVAATVQTPIFSRLIPSAEVGYRDFLARTEYLGVVCPLLVLDRPLTGYWTVNITDDSIPFTGVIETTAYIDPKYVGGHHLVYLPKYTAPGSEWQAKPPEEIKATWLEHLRRMFPGFDERHVRYFLVHRERYVEPLHGLDSTSLIPPVKTPVRNLFLATTSQIYPALTNGESVTRHAREAARLLLEDSTLGAAATR